MGEKKKKKNKKNLTLEGLYKFIEVAYFVLIYASTFMSQLICTHNKTDLCYAYTKRIIYP